MQVGFIGAGNMASAIARGLGEPVLCADPDHARAQALVAELGGEALDSNAAVAERADVVVLCHKPTQLQSVASELGGRPTAVASILGGVASADVRAAYPGIPVVRLMPNVAMEIRRGVVCVAEPVPENVAIAQLLERLATIAAVVPIAEGLIDAATGVMGVGPAYQALLAEAQVDAAVRRGIPPAVASRLVTATMSGSAALIEHRGGDTLAVRRAVTSPGGSTARGLAALEAAGVRGAFQAAIDAVIDGDR